jgi:hypothetical protein
VTVFCGIDWAERHHDVALVDQIGRVLVSTRIGDDLAGFTRLCGLLAEHTGDEFTAVDVALETDRGLLVAALRGRASGVCHQPEGGGPLPGPVCHLRRQVRPG